MPRGDSSNDAGGRSAQSPRHRPQSRPGRQPSQNPSHRQPWNGCVSSKRTSPPSSALSSASARPPSTRASHGPQHASLRPAPNSQTARDRAPRTEPAAEHDDPAARITEAITDVEQAARQYAAEQASRQALSDYAARISRQAEAQPEAHAALTAEAPADAEIEL